LEPYALGEKKWEYQQISNYNKNEFYPILLLAAQKFNNPRYLQSTKTTGNQWMNDLLYK
jgi:hypothetical protein